MEVDEPSDTCVDDKEDSLYNYHRGKLIFGLFMLDLSDAIREGDGQRLMNLYKIGLIFFNFHGSTKYFYTTLLLLVKIHAILPEGQAFRLIWNRFFNKHGWKGRNIPLDLRLEHLNNFLKACLKVLGAIPTLRACEVRFARTRLLRHALPISLLILRKKPTVLQSS